jgi:YD repeat-containing protein
VTTSHAYDDAGRETSSTTDGVTRTMTYDLAGRLLTETADDGGIGLVTQHAYDSLGRETTTIDPNDVTTTTGYDAAGRRRTTTTPAGTTTTVYDRGGSVVAVKGLDGAVTATAYDPLDRATGSIANCTNVLTTQPDASVACAGTGTHDTATNLVTRTSYDAACPASSFLDTFGLG